MNFSGGNFYSNDDDRPGSVAGFDLSSAGSRSIGSLANQKQDIATGFGATAVDARADRLAALEYANAYQAAQKKAQRKSSGGIGGILGGIAPLAGLIPGVGPVASMALGAVGKALG
jgi:hypothetical protein